MASIDSLKNALAGRSERLSVEFKPWLDVASPPHLDKFVRAMLALRNANGGTLFIGVEDDGTPSTRSVPNDPPSAYTQDILQSIVSKYSSEVFEISCAPLDHDGNPCIAVSVPAGVRTPVAVKTSIRRPDGEYFLREGSVLVRTLTANGRVSSSEARSGDWSRLMDICFENREADIGRFLRRHLPTSLEGFRSLSEILAVPPSPAEPDAMPHVRHITELFEEHLRTTQRTGSFPVATRNTALLLHGEPLQGVSSASFLARVMNAHPSFIGWPAWIDSRNFREENARPIVIDGGWSALIDVYISHRHFDFWRIDRSGRFLLKQGLEDELVGKKDGLDLRAVIDPIIQAFRVADAIATAVTFSRNAEVVQGSRAFTIAFRWERIANRRLVSWADPARGLDGGVCYDETIECQVSATSDLGVSGISPLVYTVMSTFCNAFQGAEISERAIEDISREVVTRR